MNLRLKAISGFKWSGFSSCVVTTLQFIMLAVLARLLAPSDFGLMGMVAVVLGFARLFEDMGVSNAIIHRQDTPNRVLSVLYWLGVFVGACLFLLTVITSPLVAAFYHEPRLVKLLCVSSIAFLVAPFGHQFQALLQRELRFRRLAHIEIMESFANGLVAVLLALSGIGVFSLVWGLLAGTTVRVGLLVYCGWREWRPALCFRAKGIGDYVSFGLYQMGEKTVNYLNSNLDYLLIGALLGAKALGFYALAYNLVLKPSSTLNPIITRVAFPVFSRVQDDIEKLRRGYLKVLQVLSSVNFPAMAGLAVVAAGAVPVIFGSQWTPSVVLVQILCVVGLLRSTGNPIGSLLLARGRADLGFKWNLSLMITQIPGLYVGVMLGGAVGVAIAFALLQCIYAVLNYRVLVRRLIGPCLREYFGSMWPSFWMSVVMAGAVSGIGILTDQSDQKVALVAQILLGVGVYLILMLYRQKDLLREIKDFIWSRNGDA